MDAVSDRLALRTFIILYASENICKVSTKP